MLMLLKQKELLHYMFNIREAAFKQGGFVWRSYGEQLRLCQAYNKTSWAHINPDLWWRCNMSRQPTTSTTIVSTIKQYLANGTGTNYQCIDYNKGICYHSNCKYIHSCLTCGSNRHGAYYCQVNKNSPVYKGSQSSTGGIQNTLRGQQYINKWIFILPKLSWSRQTQSKEFQKME